VSSFQGYSYSVRSHFTSRGSVSFNPGPSPGFSSRVSKNQKERQKPAGGHIFKIQYWMYVATKGPNVKWGGPDLKWEPGTLAPPLAKALIQPRSTLIILRLWYFF